MKKYEIMYILKADLEEAARTELMSSLHAIVTDKGGTIDNVDDWGLREFAYEIEKDTKGYYVVIKITANNEIIAEFDRITRINNKVVRTMILCLDDENK